jgi:hypothetical protein
MDNANPTVLNAADLPTRLGKGGASKDPPGWEIQQLMQKARWAVDDPDLSEPESESRSEDADPIDEQEIYGTAAAPLSYRD